MSNNDQQYLKQTEACYSQDVRLSDNILLPATFVKLSGYVILHVSTWAMKFKQAYSRDEPPGGGASLQELISPDNEVRFINAFVDSLGEAGLPHELPRKRATCLPPVRRCTQIPKLLPSAVLH